MRKGVISMVMEEIIRKKRDGGKLSPEEIRFVVQGTVDGSAPDYQLSALLMAVWFRGMDPEETACLTMEMADSGPRADLSRIPGFKVDKHSTGGVGDKTTLVAVPIAAACGVPCPKMSGRGLGHTGGTADKLEAIPGFRTGLTEREFFETVEQAGLSLMTQTGEAAPADKRLYALRDVTATVDSLPLIAASVMSKKIASGCDGVVLDVKAGSGAFMPDVESAQKLARLMCQIGEQAGLKVSALITNMDEPLGNTVGNAIEVEEAMDALQGGGPADLRELSLALAAEMVFLAGKGTREECRKMAEKALNSGRAFQCFQKMVSCQGGDPEALRQPFPLGEFTLDILAEQDGFLTRMEAAEIGRAAVLLGAGRSRKDDPIDLKAGVRIFKKTGDFVRKGEALARLYASNESLLKESAEKYRKALTFGTEQPELPPLIAGRIGVQESC